MDSYDKEALEGYMKLLGYGPYSEETLGLISLIDGMESINHEFQDLGGERVHQLDPSLSRIAILNGIHRGRVSQGRLI